MGYIEENYSVLNSYDYSGKPCAYSIVDTLSTPARRILGGFSASLLSQTCDNPMGVGLRVVVAVISLVIFPIALISIVALVIKVCTHPCVRSWEKKKIEVQSKETLEILSQFNSHFSARSYDKAIALVQQQPAILQRQEIGTYFFRIVNHKINQGASWEELQPLLKRLPTSDATRLIRHAVKVALGKEKEPRLLWLSGIHLIKLIQGSMRDHSLASFQELSKELLHNELQILPSDTGWMTALKIDLAGALIDWEDALRKKVSGGTPQMDSLIESSTRAEKCLFLLRSGSLEGVNIFPEIHLLLKCTHKVNDLDVNMLTSLTHEINSFTSSQEEKEYLIRTYFSAVQAAFDSSLHNASITQLLKEEMERTLIMNSLIHLMDNDSFKDAKELESSLDNIKKSEASFFATLKSLDENVLSTGNRVGTQTGLGKQVFGINLRLLINGVVKIRCAQFERLKESPFICLKTQHTKEKITDEEHATLKAWVVEQFESMVNSAGSLNCDSSLPQD